MSTEQAGMVVLQVTARDFERLCENSGNWADLTPRRDRFEEVEDGAPPFFREWKRVYWLGRDYVTVILARAFLAARGFEYEVLFDAAAGEPGGLAFGYVILTDYEEAAAS